jgi:UDP-glucuronate 4-epimerase
MAGVRPSIEQPAYYARVNVEGTTHLLQAAVTHKVGKVSLRSSSSVYGTCRRCPFSEDDPVAEPISPYAATKRSGELLCYTYWHLYKLPCFACVLHRLRPAPAAGLGDPQVHAADQRRQTVRFFGDGSTSRDYTFVSDIVAGIVARSTTATATASTTSAAATRSRSRSSSRSWKRRSASRRSWTSVRPSPATWRGRSRT